MVREDLSVHIQSPRARLVPLIRPPHLRRIRKLHVATRSRGNGAYGVWLDGESSYVSAKGAEHWVFCS